MAFVLGITRYAEPPAIFGATIEAAVASSAQPSSRIIVDDNGNAPLGEIAGFEVLRPDRNIGCAGAWNLLCRTGFERGADSVFLINGDCAVAPDTFARMMASERRLVAAHGFSCFRLDRAVWQAIGEFDEQYYPAYWEDTDYRRRLQLAGEVLDEWPFEETARPSYGRAVYRSGITHGWLIEGTGYQGSTGEKQAWFQKRWEANRERYVAKWGGMPGEETFSTPFGI
jgi:hypothetical protein